MATITLSSINNGDEGDATVVDNNFTTIATEINGNLDNNNIKTAANLDGAKFLAASIPLAKISAEAWTSWSPSFTGFSANPTVTAFYTQIGKTVIAQVETSASGTSNATTKTLTLPIAPKASRKQICHAGRNNTTDLTASPLLITRLASTTCDAYKDITGAIWTGSGTCYFDFTIIYEAN